MELHQGIRGWWRQAIFIASAAANRTLWKCYAENSSSKTSCKRTMRHYELRGRRCISAARKPRVSSAESAGLRSTAAGKVPSSPTCCLFNESAGTACRPNLGQACASGKLCSWRRGQLANERMSGQRATERSEQLANERSGQLAKERMSGQLANEMSERLANEISEQLAKDRRSEHLANRRTSGLLAKRKDERVARQREYEQAARQREEDLAARQTRGRASSSSKRGRASSLSKRGGASNERKSAWALPSDVKIKSQASLCLNQSPHGGSKISSGLWPRV